MFGTRDLLIKSEALNEVVDQFLESSVNDFFEEAKEERSLEKEEAYRKLLKKTFQKAPPTFFLLRLYQQAKQISQIIAYIWRNVGEPENPNLNTAKELQKFFVRPTEKDTEVGENLKKLLGADPTKEESAEAKLLREVFKNQSNEDLIFPIFNELELGRDPEHPDLGYLLEVNVNDFFGMLEDVDRNSPSLFKFVIPYPPRPQLSEATVTSSELEEWIVNKDKNKFFADNPYIPTTCS
ncbi:MAG: hypothetical protein V7L01_01845 [Nostoc sp.]|uniref:hypothetical protein n=1 Tax=Nostoc sp. TaxID=1180 RepID=UPI002FFD11A3